MPYAEVVSTAQPQPVRLTHRRPPVPLLGQAAGWGQIVQPAISRPSLTGCGPDSVISADPILLDTAGRLLIAVIDGRGSTHGQEHHQGERKLIRVGQLTFKAGNVMVADNRQGPERPKEAVVPFQPFDRVSNLPGPAQREARRVGLMCARPRRCVFPTSSPRWTLLGP
ncbi:MAG: hypothetical protein JWO93_3202 [Micrococcaceae bacterium]|nr:hypothetical protein [Micrococcaceae bacterium]